MLRVQTYLFYQALRALLIIVGGLSVIALLTQGLSRTDLIVESGQSAWVYLKVVGLGAPQVIGLLTPLALFVSCTWSLNRIHRDSEIVVAQAAGMTQWQVASPLIRLASIVAVLHLVMNLWVQPLAQRELRETLYEARADLATTLIRPGQFTTAGPDLTFYARDNVGGTLQGLLISDTRVGDDEADYLAETGQIREIDGKPALIMRNGQIHQAGAGDSLSILVFDQYAFDLAPFLKEETDIVLKASDRFLPELIRIDETNYLDVANKGRFLAEAHNRLTAPLLGIALTLLSLVAVLGGDYNRAGYLGRIGRASAAAITILVVHLTAQAAAADTAVYNLVQWGVPVIAFMFLAVWHFPRQVRTKTMGV